MIKININISHVKTLRKNEEAVLLLSVKVSGPRLTEGKIPIYKNNDGIVNACRVLQR